MSFYSGLDFYVCLFVLLIPAIILGLREHSLKIYRTILTVLFIFFVYGAAPKQLFYLLVYGIGSAYLVTFYAYVRKRFGRNRFVYIHALLLPLIPLVLSKGILGKSVFGFLGLSYLCFRVIQVIIEICDGVITEIGFLGFLRFLFFFPSLSSGPIDRSRRFAEDDVKIYSREEYLSLLNAGISKIVLGMLYKVVLSAKCYEILTTVFEGRYRPAYLIGYAYVYGLYLFFDFAGYSALAVGTSYILGIRMPDNFKRPFVSVDMKDFWNRWHITLSTWFRDFIFTRLLLDFIKHKRVSNRLTASACALIINMTIMGIWHGVETHYIAYGLYHGVLLALTEVYQKRSAFYKKHKESKIYRVCSWFITLNLVMFGFMIFSGHLSDVWAVVKMHI